jgi:succinoglycan biosynthesis protein ExoA
MSSDRGQSQRTHRASDSLPLVSILMPVRNEGAFIARSLGAVLGQDYPAELIEVLVVDGMSTDATRSIVASFQEKYDNLRLLDNHGQIVPIAMNMATREARGEVLVRVDGHCEIAPDYVRRCVEHLADSGADGVGGPVETVGETRMGQSIALAMSTGFGVGGSGFRTQADSHTFADTVPFPAYTREIVQAAGPYDEELVRDEDDEYNYRIRKMGGRLLLTGDVRSRYYSRSSLRSLGRQYYQYGYWKVRVAQKHPRQMRPHQFVPPTFVALLLAAALTAPFVRMARLLLALAGSSYVLVNLVASARLTAKHGGRHFLVLPAAFAFMHLGYGAGFLVGLYRFASRWLEAEPDGNGGSER